MASHNASGQMLGYLYQMRYALCLLMRSDDEDYQISMEKFDDVAFDLGGDPRQLVQVKHHLKPMNITDTSVDLWRTLNVWIDAIAADRTLLDCTDFIIVTTASVSKGSVADLIQEGRPRKAYDALKAIANNPRKTIDPYCSKFAKAEHGDMLRLLSRTRIISSTCNAVEVEDEVRRLLLYTYSPAHEEHLGMIVNAIEGWWLHECAEALSSDNPTIMTQRQIRFKVHEVAGQYRDDNLPIEFQELDGVDESELDHSDRVFLEQLRLLKSGNSRLRIAIRDYYRAVKQRSSWLRKGLLYANELERYEGRLVDEWEHAFSDMKEEYGDTDDLTEAQKVKGGKELYKVTMSGDVPIRARVSEPYVMRGTYHILANHLEVGWHMDFVERLHDLIEGT